MHALLVDRQSLCLCVNVTLEHLKDCRIWPYHIRGWPEMSKALEVKRNILLCVRRLFSAFTVHQVAGRMDNYDREWYESKPLRFTCSSVRKCLDRVKYQRTCQCIYMCSVSGVSIQCLNWGSLLQRVEHRSIRSWFYTIACHQAYQSLAVFISDSGICGHRKSLIDLLVERIAGSGISRYCLVNRDSLNLLSENSECSPLCLLLLRILCLLSYS